MGELKTKGLPSAFDEQIKTPEHDELCLELLKPETLGKAIIEFGLDEKINTYLDEQLTQMDNRRLPIALFTKKQDYAELFKSQGFLFCALEKISSTPKQSGLGGWNE